jgi:L-ascorbate metabolism protein UlaG (beta-lactamase superfamily)
MKITYYGHASLGIEVVGKHIIVDPFITGNPLANAIDINMLKADYILLTHAHYDHVLDVEAIAKNTDGVIVSNPEITTYYEKKGFKSQYMNHGGSLKFDFGTVKYVNAVHSSSFPDGTYGGNPGGFVIETESKNIYIAGDTALTYDMKLIPLRTKLDLAIFPIGDTFTMDVQDAIVASDFVVCNKIMGYHYDSNRHIEINHEESIRKFLDKGKELLLLEVGESLEL